MLSAQAAKLRHHRPVARHNAPQQLLIPKMIETQILAIAMTRGRRTASGCGVCRCRKRHSTADRSASAKPVFTKACWKACRRRGSGRWPRRLSRSCCARTSRCLATAPDKDPGPSLPASRPMQPFLRPSFSLVNRRRRSRRARRRGQTHSARRILAWLKGETGRKLPEPIRF